MKKRISIFALIISVFLLLSLTIPYSKATCACIPEVDIDFDQIEELIVEANNRKLIYSKEMIQRVSEEIVNETDQYLAYRYEKEDMTIYNRIRVGTTLHKVTLKHEKEDDIDIIIYQHGFAKTNKGEWFKSGDLVEFINHLEKAN